MKIILLFIVSLAIFLPLSAFSICTTNTPNIVNQAFIKVLDTDGNPLNPSSRYFILPADSPVEAGGVRPVKHLGDQPQNICHLAVVLSKSVQDNGMGVYLKPLYPNKYIVLNTPLNIQFYLDYPNPCNDLLVWKVEKLELPLPLLKHNISTGAKLGNPNDVSSWFRIHPGPNKHYKLVFCPDYIPRPLECINIGIVKQGGYNRLVLSENPMIFKFKLHPPIGKAEAC